MEKENQVIQVEGLTKDYGSVRAVDGISFEVQAGEIFGLIGPNGAGKTTIAEILEGLRIATKGHIKVIGLDPISQAKTLRQRVGIQLQQAALPDQIKVWEALDLFASFYPHVRDWKQLMEVWGIADKRNEAFENLSGGQKQRLFIALALVNDPELVFLDELTTGLDPQARRLTWDLIREIRDQGKTVLLVTHYMDEAEKLCDRVGIIDHGKLIALDTPKSLIQKTNPDVRVRFTTTNGFHPAALANIRGLTHTEVDGNQISVIGNTLPGTPALLLQIASILGELGEQPSDLRIEQYSLEDVFLALTGKKIRD